MTKLRLRRRLLMPVLAAALALAALAVPGGAVPARGGDRCPLKALDSADGPVEITFWHSMNRANEETLIRLTDAFNSSQSGVRVNLVNQTSYDDTVEKFRNALSTGEVPDIAQLPETFLQQAIDSQAVLPVQTCVDADDYDLSDYLPRVVDYYTVEDTLWALPFNVSNPVLYYDKNAFRAAGLDPEAPPATLEDVRTASEAIKASGYPAGFALKIDAFFFEQFLAKAGKPYVNNGNGRNERATEVEFDSRAGQEFFTFMSDMVADGLAVTNARTGPSQIDNFLALGNRQAAMTVDSTAGLGTIAQVLGTGQYAHVELGVAPMPGPVDKGGVLVGGAAFYIMKDTSDERQAAAWEYAKFMSTPENVAEWAAGTGYIPIRESSVEMPVFQQRLAEIPEFIIGYNQLKEGKNNLATAGPVIGDYLGTRSVVDEEVTRMLSEGSKPKAALKAAKKAADAIIQDYNERVGA
ncbi:MAG: ABC transporter substrate-binding protein [Actinomycetota bacterium]